MTTFEYEEWPMLYAAIEDQAERWMQTAETADDTNQYYKALVRAEEYAALLEKITKMATERFPTIETLN